MLSIFTDFLDRFQYAHQEVKQALDKLPEDAYDWRPAEGANSIAVLAMHICGAERFWIGDGALGEASGRDREEEFRAANMSKEEIVSRLDGTLVFIGEALQRLSKMDINGTCLSPRDGSEITRGWAILYALVHTALHVGHIQLTLQLWERSNSDS